MGVLIAEPPTPLAEDNQREPSPEVHRDATVSSARSEPAGGSIPPSPKSATSAATCHTFERLAWPCRGSVSASSPGSRICLVISICMLSYCRRFSFAPACALDIMLRDRKPLLAWRPPQRRASSFSGPPGIRTPPGKIGSLSWPSPRRRFSCQVCASGIPSATQSRISSASHRGREPR